MNNTKLFVVLLDRGTGYWELNTTMYCQVHEQMLKSKKQEKYIFTCKLVIGKMSASNKRGVLGLERQICMFMRKNIRLLL